MVNQYDIFLINLDPTMGSEMKKTRPCVIISPNEMNHNLNNVIIAPMTSTDKTYPTRVSVEFENKVGSIVLDQIRTVDKARLIKKLGKIDKKTINRVKLILKEMLVD